MAAANPAEQFLCDIAASANSSEQLVRDAWAAYGSPIDYGLVPFGLEKVAAMIAADFPTKVYYVPYRNNAFDTHVYQGDVHSRLWSYTSDHIAAFVRDMERIGRADDVVVMVFSEFGRRVAENTSLGTDHGTAGPAFVIGKPVLGGHYGRHAEPDGPRRREPQIHDRLPPNLLDPHPGMDGEQSGRNDSER